MTGANGSDVVRVGVDARPFAGPPCGYTIYLSSVLACLAYDGFDVTLLTNRPLLPRYTDIAGLKTEMFGHPGDLKWEQSSLPQVLAKRSFDVYFVGANRGLPVRKHPGTHYVLGLLDVIPYLFWRHYLLRPLRTRGQRKWLVREVLSQLVSLVRADSVLTISEQSARDIRRVFHRRATACLIRLASDRDGQGRADAIQSQFVYVGGVDYRKRVDMLIRAFALIADRHPKQCLVLIGANYASMRSLIDDLGLGNRVTITGFVDDDTKYRLMAQSVALIYPSLYEGYGLAIAEGFQAGTAVIAGSGGSQAEIGGEGVRVIDPESPSDIAAAMEEMLVPSIRERWIMRGEAELERLTDPAIEYKIRDFFKERARRARTCRPGNGDGASPVRPATDDQQA